MKYIKHLIPCLSLLFCLILLFSLPVSAADLTEAEVEQAVAEQGKDAVTGNIFIWFLCAIGFLKVSQKIDSYLSSLGVNVGNTGGNMMGELLIAGRSLAGAFHGHGGGFRHATSPGAAAVDGSFLSGGLAGAVGRQAERSAVNAATGYSEGGGIGNSLYQSSLKKGGAFANQVVGDIARGDYGKVGSITGADAAKAFAAYMGLNEANDEPVPNYTNMEIGGGRITGSETIDGISTDFAMYDSEQYVAPSGNYETVQSVDGATWYKQYAQDTVERKPYTDDNGNIAYHESIVQVVPPAPARKDRI